MVMWRWQNWLIYYCSVLVGFYVMFHMTHFFEGKQYSFRYEIEEALSGSLAMFAAMLLFIKAWPRRKP